MTNGSGQTWLTTIDFNGESITSIQIDYRISMGTGNITIYDTFPKSLSE